jgi:hypothetical protein
MQASAAGGVESARARVARRLRARHDSLVEAIFARVSGEAFGHAGGDDARYVEGLRETVGEAVRYALVGIERGGEGLGPVPEQVLAQARRAARAGVSLDTVLRRYVAGHTLLADEVVQEIERIQAPGGRGALGEIARIQSAVLDRLLAVIAAEYRHELDRTGSSHARRLLERVHALLEDEHTDHDTSREEGSEPAAGLGYALDRWHLGLIAHGPDAQKSMDTLAKTLGCALLCVPDGENAIWAWLGARTRLLPADVQRAATHAVSRAASDAAPGVMLVLGEPAEGLAGWRTTHHQARATLAVALARPRPITRYADVALLAIALTNQTLADALMQAYIAPLQDSRVRGTVLCDTLRTYLQTQRSPSSTAAALGVARTTVENRLRTIEQHLSRPLHTGSPELEIALALQDIGYPTHHAY